MRDTFCRAGTWSHGLGKGSEKSNYKLHKSISPRG